jgi:hypothetical protein
MKSQGALVRKQTIMENLSYQNEISNSSLGPPESHRIMGAIKSERSMKLAENYDHSDTAKQKLAIYSMLIYIFQ